MSLKGGGLRELKPSELKGGSELHVLGADKATTPFSDAKRQLDQGRPTPTKTASPIR